MRSTALWWAIAILELVGRLESMFAVDGAKTLEAPDFAPGGPTALTDNCKDIARKRTSVDDRRPEQNGCHKNELKACSVSV